MPNANPEERHTSRTEPADHERDARRSRSEEERRAPQRDDEHDGGFGDGPLL
jgi:hypothetical protein